MLDSSLTISSNGEKLSWLLMKQVEKSEPLKGVSFLQLLVDADKDAFTQLADQLVVGGPASQAQLNMSDSMSLPVKVVLTVNAWRDALGKRAYFVAVNLSEYSCDGQQEDSFQLHPPRAGVLNQFPGFHAGGCSDTGSLSSADSDEQSLESCSDAEHMTFTYDGSWQVLEADLHMCKLLGMQQAVEQDAGPLSIPLESLFVNHRKFKSFQEQHRGQSAPTTSRAIWRLPLKSLQREHVERANYTVELTIAANSSNAVVPFAFQEFDIVVKRIQRKRNSRCQPQPKGTTRVLTPECLPTKVGATSL
eukprot:TRINITY_DN14978_c0_g3_i1.p1 TRINITY_DN14978_c0_g3~~TRINITY_DN14978_c0_g3_i1.p1  ORF type:complete len:305 (+),score=30.82 TRINITY_DN14978_c0_g3_i1:85-999(+)